MLLSLNSELKGLVHLNVHLVIFIYSPSRHSKQDFISCSEHKIKLRDYCRSIENLFSQNFQNIHPYESAGLIKVFDDDEHAFFDR